MRTRQSQIKREPNTVVPESSDIPSFVYNGGPIVRCPLIYTSFWSQGTYYDQGLANYINEAFRNILKSNFMNVLSQYGVGTGAGGFVGAFMQDLYVRWSPPALLTLTDSLLQVIVQNLIDVGNLPEPGISGQNNIVFMIFLDDTIQFSDPQTGHFFCAEFGDLGYHSSFTTRKGNNCYYAVISSCSDDCLNKGGCLINPNPDCTLNGSLTMPQRLTIVASHEFAELTTDPESPQSLSWASLPGPVEVGDICAFLSEIEILAVGSEFVTVTKIYSKADDTSISSNLDNYCLGQAASPKPPLNPGPHAITHAVQERMRPASFERLLPLPSVYVDMNTADMSISAASRDREEVKRYIQKIFHPLQHEDVFSDFPEFLHQIANVLATKEAPDT